MNYKMDRPEGRRVVKYDDRNAYVELVNQPLYDRKQVVASATQNILFFKNLSGSTLLDTNLTVDGMLPTPQAFSCYGLAAFVQQGVPEADLVKLVNESSIEFRLSNKPYLQCPFHLVPSPGGLRGFAALDAQAAPTSIFQAQNGAGFLGFLPLDIDGDPIHLVSQQDFVCVLSTHNSAAFSTAFYVTMYLMGVLYRPVL